MSQVDPDLFESLVGAARLAPSPDNNQPWAFSRSGEEILVHHVRERAIPSDVEDLFSWLALGAAIENLALAATGFGFATRVRYEERPFPTTGDGEIVARLRLYSGAEADLLHEAIAERVTNRAPYRRDALPEVTLRRLSGDAGGEEGTVHFLTGRPEVRRIARLVRSMDRIRFEHRPFHEELFRMLRFREADAEAKGDGLSMKALRIPRLQVPMIRPLRSWRRMRIANLLGASRMFAGMASRTLVASGALAFLLTTERSDRAYLEAGRQMERLWLSATRAGLAAQPVGSLPLFLLRLRAAADDLPARFRSKIEYCDRALREILPVVEGRVVAILLRIGVPTEVAARSARYPTARITS